MMKNNMKIFLTLILLLGLATGLATVSVTAKNIAPPEAEKPLTSEPSLSPAPSTIAVAIHNTGNIVTTIDNHGYIGGRTFFNLPSGEWPRNSGHDYIGEIMYWMGATLPSGDTAVANSWDEFQAMPALISGHDDHSIMVSTDTSTYFDYDVSDTIGIGYGNPAHGWKVWNADSSAYVYRQNYSPELGGDYPGGPLAVQETHYRFNDAANGSSLMGLEITHSGLQWNYCYNEDFIFFDLEITNTSENDYADFAFGLYIDLDVGGPDGTGENGRLEDLIAVDSAENLAWIYDEDGHDQGWGDYTGVMGTKLLETPDDIGLTGLRTGDFMLAPDTDEERYTSLTEDVFETTLPPTDQYYVQCVSGINLTAGKTVRVVWALIAGDNEEDFKATAQRAQQFYDDNYVGAQPPITPTLTVRAGDEKIYLSWNDTSQTSVDPRSGEADFKGYKLYRSGDWGRTWGRVNDKNSNQCLDVDYYPLAQYAVLDPTDPIPHTYIDTGLHNDREYWYCLAAYDAGDDSVGIDPLQSGFGIADQAINVVRVTPRDDAAGLISINDQVNHINPVGTVPSDGEVYPIVFDRDALKGTDYQVVFTDDLDVTHWHLINVTTSDTILAYQDIYTGDEYNYELVDGLRVVVRDGDPLPRSMGQTAFSGADTTLAIDVWWGITAEAFGMGRIHSSPLRPTYELRVTGDSTMASPLNAGTSLNIAVPFEIWDVDANIRVTVAVYDWDLDGYQPYDLLAIIKTPYDEVIDPFGLADIWPYEFAWLFAFDTTSYAPAIGDTYTIAGAPLNGPADLFTFSTNVNINSDIATSALQDIHVVPNPYNVRYSSFAELTSNDNFLKFSGVPDKCKIRIYTLAGDLVRTLDHNDGTGYTQWDLLSNSGQQVASGIYIYHVESPYGERLGRFAIIK